MHLRLEVHGDVQLSRDLLRWANAAADMTPAFEDIAELFYGIETKQFDSEGGYASRGWRVLRPRTVLEREKHHPGYGNHPILRYPGEHGGTLRRSLTQQGAKGSIRRITSDAIEIGTSVEYAKFHQRGTKYMSRRRPVELTDADKKRFVKIIQRELVHNDRQRRGAA